MPILFRKRTIVFLILIGFFFVPYFGPYRLFKVVYSVYLMILGTVFLCYFNELKLSNLEKIISGTFFLQAIWIFVSIYFNSILYDIPYSISNFGEISRPLLNALLFYACVYLYKNSSSKVLTYTLIGLLFVTLFNFFLSFSPKLMINSLKPIIDIYGEGKIYTMGYANWRAFGIVGQPGKNAAFCCILCIALYYFVDKGYNRGVIYLGVFINLLAILLTVSRTGLIIFIMIVVLIILFTGKIRYFFTTLIVGFLVFSFVNNTDYYDPKVLLRGLTKGSKISTFDKRLYLKTWSLEVISIHTPQLLIGTGPSKEYLQSFDTNYANDLSLTAPDSSYTLWMLRYGFGGLILFSLPYLIIGSNYINSFKYNKSLYVLLITLITAAQIDPVFHEPKIQTITWIIIVLNISKNGEPTHNRFVADRGN